MTTLDAAIAQMRANGMPDFPVGHPKINDDRWHRYGPKSKAYYKLREVTGRNGRSMVFGTYGFKSNGPFEIEADFTPFDADERERFRREQREAQEKEQRNRAERARFAAARARQQWEAGGRTGPWPYLDRKQVTPERVRCFDDGKLLVPVYAYTADVHAVPELVGLQKISADGSKLFNKGMAKAGRWLELGEVDERVDEPIVLVAEGYATARSIRMAIAEQNLVVVAWDAGNLLSVGQGLRQRYPSAHLIFAADDDFATQGNPGITKAHAAASANGAEHGKASVARPLFAPRTETSIDFNDLHCAEGLDQVKAQIIAAIVAAMQLMHEARGARDRADVSESQSTDERDATGDPGPSGDGSDSPGGPPQKPPRAARSTGSGARDDDWRDDLRRTDKGMILSTPRNIALILSHDESISGVIGKNEFSEAVEKLRQPPYPYGEIGEWQDLDDSRLGMWIESKYGFTPRPLDLVPAVLEVADRNRFHPPRDWLNSLEHDGVERLRNWMIDWLGAPNTEYTRLVSEKFLVMAVARIMRPGIKADNVMILEGRQGLRKSSALKALAGEKFFTDTPIEFGDKETYLLMQGMWFIEMAELDSLTKSEASKSKQFFGQVENYYRPWYAKRPIRVKRQCIFCGSVNDAQYLKDDTGNRRYWPVKCSSINLDAIVAARDQLFAEAMTAYRAGVPHWVLEDERPLFEEEQDERYVGDAWIQKIEKFFESAEEANHKEWSMATILGGALGLDVAKWTRAEQIRAGHCLRKLGLDRRRSSAADRRGVRNWVYAWPQQVEVSANETVRENKSLAGDEDDAPF